jgi:hypothetical protein
VAENKTTHCAASEVTPKRGQAHFAPQTAQNEPVPALLQVGFEINAKKMRMPARAKISLESATECGKVDVGRAAHEDFSLVHFRLYVVHSRMPEFSRARCIAQL